MDGASAAATVLQLVETGITVSNALYQYGKSVKNANTSCIRLIDDIKLVVNIAHVANHLFSKSPTATVSNELSQYWLTPQSPAIKCKKMLEELQTKMLSGDGGPMKLRAKLRWPFTEAEIKGKIEAFEKYLPYLQLSLQTVHMEALTRIEAQARHADDEIARVKESLKHVSDDVNKGFQNVGSVLNTLADKEVTAKVLQWLDPIDCVLKHEATYKLRQPTTCEWLFREESFRSWRSTQASFLWINGKPGAGKSVLASTIIQHLASALTSGEMISYAYCDFRAERSTHGFEVLRSLFTQMLQEVTCDWQQYFRDLLHRHAKGIPSPQDLDTLCDWLLRILKLYHRPIIVIDALDECKDYPVLIHHLVRLSKEGSCRVFVTSRPLQDISSALRELPSLLLDSKCDETLNDMKLHITMEVGSREKLVSFRDEIIQSLLRKADGMFRWVQCQLDRLNLCRTRGDIRHVLDTLPTGLYETYDRILIEIEKREFDGRRVRNALLWLVARPVKLDRLVEVVMLDPEEDSSQCAIEFLRDEDLLEACGSLVRVDDGFWVSLSHFSVKEYLSDGHLRMTLLDQYHVSLLHVHSQLVLRCIRHLLSYEFPRSPTTSEFSSLKRVQYAMTLGLSQFGKITPTDLDDALVESLFAIRTQVQSNPAKYLHLHGLRLGCTEAYIVPDAGTYILIKDGPSDPWLLRKYLARNCEFNLADVNDGDSPLIQALQYGQLQLAQMLLDSGLDVDKFGVHLFTSGESAMHPLAFAVMCRDETSIAFLLSQRCSLPQDIVHTAVHSADGEGAVSIVTLLMEHGASVTVLRAGGNNPLHSLLSAPYTNRHSDILNLTRSLVDAGCDPTAENDSGDTPLQLAIDAGPVYWDVITYLLCKGAAFTNVHFPPDNLSEAAHYPWYTSAADAACTTEARRSTTLMDVCRIRILLEKRLKVPSSVVTRTLDLARYWACASFSYGNSDTQDTKQFLLPERRGIHVQRIQFSAKIMSRYSAWTDVELHPSVESRDNVVSRFRVHFGGFPVGFTAVKSCNRQDPEYRKVLESLKPGHKIRITCRGLQTPRIDIFYSATFTDKVE